MTSSAHPLPSHPLPSDAEAVTLVAVGALVLAAPLLPPVLAGPVVLGYLLVAPGLAVLPSFGRGVDALMRVLCAIALSLSLAILASTVMAEVEGWWQPHLLSVLTVLLIWCVVAQRTLTARRARAQVHAPQPPVDL